MYLPEFHSLLYFYNEEGTLYYEFYFEGKRLFYGNDYRRPGFDPFSIISMVCLLEIIADAPNVDTRKYFENHTTDQLAWCRTTQCLYLAHRIYDYKRGLEKDQAEAEAYFEGAYTKYIHEDIFTLNDVAGKNPEGKNYMTVGQRNNLRRLFLKNRLGEASKNKIDAAIEDDFSRLEKDAILEAISFDGEQVTFKGRHSYTRELSNIIKRIFYKY